MKIAASTTPPEAAANPKVWKAAQDFEAMALGALLQPMFETVDMTSNPFGGGAGEAAFRPMLVQEMAKGMAQRGGLGLANSIFTQLLRTQEHGSGPDARMQRPNAAQAQPMPAQPMPTTPSPLVLEKTGQ